MLFRSVTASQDSTLVTVTPSVTTMLGQPAGVPVQVMLMRGDCYSVKADSSDHPITTSLCGSKVHATKPVSVVAGNSCAYVPLSIQSCNELLDEQIGSSWWGSDFFVQPLGNLDSMIEIQLVSDREFYASINGSLQGSTNEIGRAHV